MISLYISKIRSLGPVFFTTVVIPTIIAILYYGIFASDIYISESQFVVRSPEKPAQSGLGLLLKSSAFTNAGDEIFAAQNYVLSRDALQDLEKNRNFSNAYGNKNISIFDRFDGMGGDSKFEDLFKYYKKKVSVKQDSTSSIVTLTVRAYSSKDAHDFNERLLEMAESTVNKMNLRGRQDLIRFAKIEVEDAQKASQSAMLALSKYRNRQGVVDPEKQASIQLQMISKLQDELIATRTQLREIRSFAPENPQIEVLETRAKGIAVEMDEALGLVAGKSGSLSSQAAQYQRLQMDNQFAERQLAAALTSLEEARNEARRKQAYVERIVEPNRPDAPLEPRRSRGIFSAFVLGLAAWGILSMLLAGLLEHKD